MPKFTNPFLSVTLVLSLGQAAAVAAPLSATKMVSHLSGDYIGFDLEQLGMRKEVTCRVVIAQYQEELLLKIAVPGRDKVELKHIPLAQLTRALDRALEHPEQQDFSLGKDLLAIKLAVAVPEETGVLELTWNQISQVLATLMVHEGAGDDFERTIFCGGLVKVN